MGRPIAQEVPPTTRYEPLTVYDKPGVALQMLFDGPTLEGFRNLALSPKRLSPTQRQTLGARLQEMAGVPRGQSRFVDAAVGVATNPLVWLSFLMLPPAAALIKRGATVIGPSVAKGAAFAEHAGLSVRLGLANAEQAAAGTYVGPTLRAVAKMAHEASERDLVFNERLKAWMKKYNVPHLTSEDPSLTGAQKKMIRDLEAYVPLRMMQPDERGFWVNRVHNTALAEHARHTPVLDKGRVVRYEESLLGANELGEIATTEARKVALKRELEMLSQAKSTLIAQKDAQVQLNGAPVMGRDGIKTINGMMREKIAELRGLPEYSAKIRIGENASKSTYVGVTADQVREMARQRPELEEFAQLFAEGLDESLKRALYADGKIDPLRAAKTLQMSALNKEGQLYVMVMGGPTTAHQGEGAEGLFHHNLVKNGVKFGRVSQGKYVEDMAEFVRRGIEEKGGGYFPRNVMEEKQVVGGVLTTSRVVDGADLNDLYRAASGRTKGLTEKRDYLDPEWFERVHDLFGTQESLAGLNKAKEDLASYAAMLAGKESAMHPVVLTPQHLHPTVMRARKDLSQVEIMTAPAPQEVVQSQRAWASQMAKEGVIGHSVAARPGLPSGPSETSILGAEPRRASVLWDWTKVAPQDAPIGGFRMLDYAETGIDTIRDPHARSTVQLAWQSVMGRLKREGFYTGQSLVQAKQYTDAFIKSGVGQTIAGMGGPGKAFIDMLQRLSDPKLVQGEVRGLQGGLVKLLYNSHLAINVAASLINGMQPLTYGAMVYGWKPTVMAFVDSLGEMQGYLTERIQKYGIKAISHEERLPLLKKHFKWADQMGVDLEFAHQMDSMIYNGRLVPTGGLLDRVGEGMMKTFEYSERLNRAWTANIVARAHHYAGRPIDAKAIDQIGQAVRTFQFVSDPVSTPAIFQKGPLSNPLAKMFMTYPVRAAYTAGKVLPEIFDKESYWRGFGMSVAAGLGTSALVYELGKGLFGADLSRGLYAASATDVVGGQKFLEDGKDWIPVPPVIAIPKDFLAGVATGDKRAVADAVLRSMPGGVALGRALQSLPELPTPFSVVQKGSVGWSQPLKDGRVPVYSADGKLVDFQSPSAIVFKSLGVDLGTSRRGSEVDGYLATQREEINSYRTRYVNSLLANDFNGAARVQQEFGKKFKDPVTRNPLKITVTQSQLRQAMKTRETPRPERMLNSFAPGVREAFGQVAASTSPQRFNVPVDQLYTSSTAGQRDRESFNQ